MDCSMPDFPFLCCLPEIAQTHVHWISDANQPSNPLSFHSLPSSLFSSPGSFLMSQLFASGDQSIGALASATVILINIQNLFPLGLTALVSLLSKGISRVFFNTITQKHQVQPSLWSDSHINTLLWKNHRFNYTHFGQQSNISAF